MNKVRAGARARAIIDLLRSRDEQVPIESYSAYVPVRGTTWPQQPRCSSPGRGALRLEALLPQQERRARCHRAPARGFGSTQRQQTA